MTEALDYVSRPTFTPRRSSMATWAITISLVQVPFFFVVYFLGVYIPSLLPPSFLGASFILLPIFGFFLGTTAAIRCSLSNGHLKGGWTSLFAAILAVAWPVGVIYYIIAHVGIC